MRSWHTKKIIESMLPKALHSVSGCGFICPFHS
jgi:hypothetical protein